MADSFAVGRLQAALGQMTHELTVAAANINFDFTLVKMEAPPEYQGLGPVLSTRSKRNAESGPSHVLANRLSALFEDVCPPTPNLIKAYGTRISEISKELSTNDSNRKTAWIFSEFTGIDATSLWAAATSSRGALPMHLLACMLARMWTDAEATSLWVEVVEERRREIVSKFERGEPVKFSLTAAAAQQEITREQLSSWDASARAWLRAADTVKNRLQKQLLLILKNIELPVNTEVSPYRSIIKAWASALETIEALISGSPHVVKDGSVLIALSAWHLYPDLLVFGGRNPNKEIKMNDHLVKSGGMLSLGISDDRRRGATEGVYWSLSLAHHRFYGRPVPKTGTLNDEQGRVTFEELQQVILGAVLGHWHVQKQETTSVLKYLIVVLSSLDVSAMAECQWIHMMQESIVNYLTDEAEGSTLLSLGRRRHHIIIDGTVDWLPPKEGEVDKFYSDKSSDDEAGDPQDHQEEYQDEHQGNHPEKQIVHGQAHNQSRDQINGQADELSSELSNEGLAHDTDGESSIGLSQVIEIKTTGRTNLKAFDIFDSDGEERPTSQPSIFEDEKDLNIAAGFDVKTERDNGFGVRDDSIHYHSNDRPITRPEDPITSSLKNDGNAQKAQSSLHRREHLNQKTPAPIFGLESIRVVLRLMSDPIDRIMLLRRLAGRAEGLGWTACLIAYYTGDDINFATVFPTNDPIIFGVAPSSFSATINKNSRAQHYRWVSRVHEQTALPHETVEKADRLWRHDGAVLFSLQADQSGRYDFLYGDVELAAVYAIRGRTPLKSPHLTSEDGLWCYHNNMFNRSRMLRHFETQTGQVPRVLTTLAIAARTYYKLSLEGATISCRIFDKPFKVQSLVHKARAAAHPVQQNLMEYLWNCNFALDFIGFFETGYDIVNGNELDGNLIGLSAGDSLYIPTRILEDPSSWYPRHSYTMLLGNVGKPGLTILVSPQQCDVRDLSEVAWRQTMPAFDGGSEDHFDRTSLHLAFTEWTSPLAGSAVGLREPGATICEAVVQVRDSGRWVADVNAIKALASPVVTRYKRVQPTTCDHTFHGPGPNSRLVTIDTWDQVLDCPEGVLVTKSHGNALARLALATVIAEHCHRNEVKVVICPEGTICWSCIESRTKTPNTVFVY